MREACAVSTGSHLISFVLDFARLGYDGYTRPALMGLSTGRAGQSCVTTRLNQGKLILNFTHFHLKLEVGAGPLP